MMRNVLMEILAMVILACNFLFLIAIVYGSGDAVICSTCGHSFKKSHINTVIGAFASFPHAKREYLKCPKCKVRNECSSSRL